MIYNENSITEKRKSLYSAKEQLRSSIFVSILYVVLILAMSGAVAVSGFMYGAFRAILITAPEITDLKPETSATMIYDMNGKAVQQLSDYSSNRIPVEDAPEDLKNAFIAIEDERFYEHNGVDLKGIIRALISDLSTGTPSQGASTITQQLIKNRMFDTGGEDHLIPKIRRKIQEQIMAIQTEKVWSKDEILIRYLNTINLGKGTLGVETASQYYFHKSSADLNLSECAVLAGITKNPSALNPVDHPEASAQRKELVLRKMLDLNYISSKDYQTAIADDVYTRVSENTANREAAAVYSYYTDALITQIVSDLQTRKGYSQSQAFNIVYKGGLRIHSVQDSEMQKIADDIINNKNNYPVNTEYSMEYTLKVTHADDSFDTYNEADVRKYFANKKKDKNYSTVYSSKEELEKAAAEFKKAILTDGDKVREETVHYSLEPQLSFSLIDQKTGEVKVLVGGRGKKKDDLALNRATAVTRQPGSTFKILAAYAPAIDSGTVTLATALNDAPYKYSNGVRVRNYDKKSYKGMTTIRDAIRESNNIVAVKTLTKITPQTGYDYLVNLGFTTLVSGRANSEGALESDINQSLALGGITDGVTNLELTAAYCSIANKGTYNTPILYTTVEDSEGNVILENKPEPRQVMKESTAWLLTDAMRDVVSSGTGTEAKLTSDMPVAGKTGTSSNNYDYWFCGYTPYYTASIWTGYDYNTNFTNEGDYHKVIWRKIMDKIIEKKKLKTKDFPACKDIISQTICAKSGKLPLEGICSNDPEHSMVRTEYFEAGTEPTDRCESHISVTVCQDTNKTAGKYCPHKVTRVYRVKPKGSSGKTDDDKYLLTFDPDKVKCTVHTKDWYEKDQERKRLEE
ncbi:MAG: PBP1A family penicillin-binding protein, partial [Eubacterium sp.]|nr:PBP1A family penicillin-binding protein [Eubacterium sp.]